MRIHQTLSFFVFLIGLLFSISTLTASKVRDTEPRNSCNIRNFLTHFFLQNSKVAEPLVLDSYDLNSDGVNDFFVTDQRTCGSKGCEYYLYLKGAKDCFQYVGSLDGHILEVVNSRQGAFKKIKISQRNGHLSEPVYFVYEYDPKKNSYQLTFNSANDEL